MPKTSPKAPTTRSLTEGISAASSLPEQLRRHAGHHDLLDPAGDDQVEQIEIGKDVEREAVEGHPLLHVDADARDLPARGPHAGAARVPVGLDAERRRAPGSATSSRLRRYQWRSCRCSPEVENGIAYQLPRRVEGDVTPALDLEHLDAAALQLRRRQRQTGSPRAPAERNDGRMLHQQQHVLGERARRCARRRSSRWISSASA